MKTVNWFISYTIRQHMYSEVISKHPFEWLRSENIKSREPHTLIFFTEISNKEAMLYNDAQV